MSTLYNEGVDDMWSTMEEYVDTLKVSVIRGVLLLDYKHRDCF